MAGKREMKRKHRGFKLIGTAALMWAASLIFLSLTGSADAGSVPLQSAKPGRNVESVQQTEPAQEAESVRQTEPVQEASLVGPAEPVQEAETIVPWGQPMPSVSAVDVYLPEDPLLPPDRATVALSTPVDDDYFADAAFLGDSRTEGFKLYSGLRQGSYFYSVGATVDTVITKPTWKTPKGKVPLVDAMKTASPAKIYVMLGVNELGWPRTEVFRQYYTKLVERIQADHPDSVLVLQSILPVSAVQEAKHTYVNNHRIKEFNTVIREVAEAQACRFLNVAEAVTDEAGNLPEELSFDGVHLNRAGCAVWLEYLKTHAV